MAIQPLVLLSHRRILNPELFEERHRDALRAACGEDSEIWEIYANNFGPDGFDDSIEAYTSNPRNRTFVLFEGEELAGMSS